VPQILEYVNAAGVSPFAEWREKLDATVRARVTLAVYRLEAGNFSAAKGAGAGIFELRLDFGPGYRVYFGKDGEQRKDSRLILKPRRLSGWSTNAEK
jgi:putative addiction module killer protein